MKILIYFLFLTVFISCASQKKSAISVDEWKKIEDRNAQKDAFENSTLTLLSIDTVFVDNVFNETFTAVDMYWGESTDKFSFKTQHKGSGMTVKNIDLYYASKNLYLAMVYYSDDKNMFYEQYYYENGRVIITFFKPHDMRAIKHDLSQFIGIANANLR